MTCEGEVSWVMEVRCSLGDFSASFQIYFCVSRFNVIFAEVRRWFALLKSIRIARKIILY